MTGATLYRRSLPRTVPQITKTKRVTLQISGNGSSPPPETTLTDIAQRIKLELPVAPFRYRFKVRNPAASTGVGYPGALAFSGFWLSPAFATASELSGDGFWKGGVTAAMSRVLAPFNTPADGSEYTSGWVDATGNAAIQRDKTYVLGWGFTCDAGTSLGKSSYGVLSWHGTGAAASAGTGPPSSAVPAGAGANYQAAYLDVRLEYEFLTMSTGGVPVVLGIGDSITAGDSDAGYGAYPHQTWLGAAGLRGRFAWVNLGVGGTALAAWLGDPTTDWHYTRADLVTTVPDAAVILLGTNDINNDAIATDVETKLQGVIANCKTLGIPKVYLGTIIPRAFASPKEPVRAAVNTWIRNAPSGVAGVCDFDRAIRDPADKTRGDSDFLGSPQTHPLLGGYQKMGLEALVVAAA